MYVHLEYFFGNEYEEVAGRIIHLMHSKFFGSCHDKISKIRYEERRKRRGKKKDVRRQDTENHVWVSRFSYLVGQVKVGSSRLVTTVRRDVDLFMPPGGGVLSFTHFTPYRTLTYMVIFIHAEGRSAHLENGVSAVSIPTASARQPSLC